MDMPMIERQQFDRQPLHDEWQKNLDIINGIIYKKNNYARKDESTVSAELNDASPTRNAIKRGHGSAEDLEKYHSEAVVKRLEAINTRMNDDLKSILVAKNILEIELFQAYTVPETPLADRIAELEDRAKKYKSYFNGQAMQADLKLSRDEKLSSSDLQAALILAYGYNVLTYWALTFSANPIQALMLITQAMYFTGHAESIYLELSRAVITTKAQNDRKNAAGAKANKFYYVKEEAKRLLIVKASDDGWKNQITAIDNIKDDLLKFDKENGNVLKDYSDGPKDLVNLLKSWFGSKGDLRPTFDAYHAKNRS